MNFFPCEFNLLILVDNFTKKKNGKEDKTFLLPNPNLYLFFSLQN